MHIEHDWVINDVCAGAAHLLSKLNNLVSHLGEVSEFLALDFLRELSPGCGAFGRVSQTEF